MRTCAIAAAALLIASAFAADTTMITFDGASGTTHSFKAVRSLYGLELPDRHSRT